MSDSAPLSPFSTPDRADYERRCQSSLWQVRAQALLEIRDHQSYRHWFYRDTEENRASGLSGSIYPSLGAFAEDLPQPIAYKTSYGTAKLAEAPHFRHYELLRTAPINLVFARRLYALAIDHPLIEPLLLYLHLGGREEEATRVLKEELDPLPVAISLLDERLSQLPELLERSRVLLDIAKRDPGLAPEAQPSKG